MEGIPGPGTILDVSRPELIGWIEQENISSSLGLDESLNYVKKLYQDGHVSKEDFAAALRGYQIAIAATKSPQREVAYEFSSLKEE